MKTALSLTLVTLFLIGCTSTEETENQDFSMRYEVCRHGYAGPWECPKLELQGETAEF